MIIRYLKNINDLNHGLDYEGVDSDNESLLKKKEKVLKEGFEKKGFSSGSSADKNVV